MSESPESVQDRLARAHLEAIRNTARKIPGEITIMEVCGGHTNLIMDHGIKNVLPENLRLISGPGCPVCVTPQEDIDAMVDLAMEGVPVATYGDMLRVPGTRYSLEQARAMGALIYEVYSATQVLEKKREHPDIVFFGVGFETTSPMTAYLLKKGVMVASSHRLIPPAMMALLEGEVRVDGFINPGHVSTIIGTKPYENIPAPQVVAGFTPERFLRAVRILLEMIAKGDRRVVNAYPEAVRPEGNPIALREIRDEFVTEDALWRGLGVIPSSGLEVKNKKLDAKREYPDVFNKKRNTLSRGCRCGDVLRGVIEPPECPLYARACTPESPKGACMVSREGACNIYYHHGEARWNNKKETRE